MAELDPIVERELQRMHELGLLETGELVVEHETSVLEHAVGAVVVTDMRVVFISTTLWRKRTKTRSVSLLDIEGARPAAVWGMKDRGELTLTLKVGDGGDNLVFGQIPRGEARAAEIANAILRERERLLDRDARV